MVNNYSGNVCPHCWKGILRAGICTVCGRPLEKNRRTDALPLGTVLNGRYRIGEVLGNGGFGITYSSWDQQKQCRVALKEMFPRTAVYRGNNHATVCPNSGQTGFVKELQSRFEREANLLLLLRGQDNLIQVYDLFRCNGTSYYTMEFLEGCDLQSYRKANGPISWQTLEPMMREILISLGQLHEKNLIHRDISPDNLFLTNDHHMHLIDFGSVRAYQGNNNFTAHLKDSFAPWEQYISNGRQGPWTDIYSLSVTMYLLLSGKLPPKAGERKNGERVIPLRTLAPTVPEYVAAAIERGMAVSIEDRFQTTAAFMRALGMGAAPSGTWNRTENPATRSWLGWLQGQSGVYSGQHRRLETEQEILIGRSPECQIRFPEHTQGVSRRQCAVYVKKDGTLFVRDAGSSYGTFLNQTRLSQSWTAASWGSVLWFGQESFRLLKQ